MAFVVPAFIGSGVVLVLGLVGMLIVRRRQKE
jgi:LPXTG-motif cell wall-anchored protein